MMVYGHYDHLENYHNVVKYKQLHHIPKYAFSEMM